MKEKGQLEELNQQIEKLQNELIQMKKQTAEYLSGWQRAAADYANLQKEKAKSQEDFLEMINAAAISEILPIYDHFKMALKHLPSDRIDQAWLDGLRQIQKQFQDFLKKFNIKEIKTVGEKFNPNLHEAISHEAREGLASDLIFEEVKPGYLLGDKLINPAQVRVSK